MNGFLVHIEQNLMTKFVNNYNIFIQILLSKKKLT